LDALRARDLFRTPRTLDAVDGPRLRVGRRWLLNFSSNDYLGFSTHPRLIAAACAAARRWGVGARASRLLAGSTAAHDRLEAALARWFGAEAAIVFSSGYLANLGALHALLKPGDVAVVDRLAHASLVDAARTSGARLLVFAHNDPESLDRALRRPRPGRAVVITEGRFSMDGDLAPLARLLAIANRREAVVYLDDAHGVFATGPRGRGTLEGSGVSPSQVLLMGTLGKALGCHGGFLVGPRRWIAWLRNRARSFIYSTALPTPVAAAALEGLRLLARDRRPIRALAANARRLRDGLEARGLPTPAQASHIVPLVVGETARARALAQRLWDAGVFAPAIRPPTVPAGTARLRLSLTAAHRSEHIDACLDAIARGWR
jgi:8-amino-7-oxononanoate synthase